MKTNDAKISLNNNNFELLDSNGKIVFTNPEWYEVRGYASSNNWNIVYYPKDLIFSFEPGEDGMYLFLDIKYGGGGHDNLGSHNVIDLPDYVSEHEDVECHFPFNEQVSQAKIVKDMTALGAEFVGKLEIKSISVKNK